METESRQGSGHVLGRRGILLLAALVVIAAGLAFYWFPQRALAARLVSTEPAVLLKDVKLRDQAVALGRPVYASHCATCHGAKGEGDRKRGIPAMNDADWLYGNDLVDLEQTILYGIRSGHPKARNLAEMPAMGRTAQITDADARDAVEYVLQLSHQQHDAAAAERGKAIYFGKGNCYDCHASDARGVTDYGTPPLLGTSWVYGGDRDTLYRSIYSGRHGKCPSWVNKLTPAQIRELAVMFHEGVLSRER
jgi:cytochrome c oxidase cbb3-type subunit 3